MTGAATPPASFLRASIVFKMKRLRSLLIGWLCTALALAGVLNAVLPVLEQQHMLEHGGAIQLAAQHASHDGDDHSHHDGAIDLVSTLGTLLGVASALASAFLATSTTSFSAPVAVFDPPTVVPLPHRRVIDPPDRPPRLLA